MSFDIDIPKGNSMEELIVKWIKLSNKLAQIKETEMDLRKQIADHILAGKVKGSKTATIGKYKLSATAKVNTKIEREELQAIWPDLTAAEKAAVKFDPKLVAVEYKKVPANSIIHSVITDTPGAPSLSVKGIVK